MKAGARKSYGFVQKTHWRRWAWNRICERLKSQRISPADAVVVGLLGKEALDLVEAERRGFLRENFFAVERDEDAMREIRRLGVNTIHGKLSDVLWAWHGEEINVVLMDLCGALTSEADSIQWALVANSLGVRGAILLNTVRGHDREIAGLVGKLKGIIAQAGVAEKVARRRAGAPIEHRGLWGYWEQTGKFVESGASALCGARHGKRAAVPTDLIRSLSDDVLRATRPSYQSYRSGRLVFDSAVFSWRPPVPDNAALCELIRESYGELSKNARMKRRVTAARAVRTRRHRVREWPTWA